MTNHLLGRRAFLTSTAAGALGLGVARALGANVWDAGSKSSDDPPNTHNMLVFGAHSIFLSHLPMFDGPDAAQTSFRSPHRYQVILEAAFSGPAGDVGDVYVKDRQVHLDTRIYTLSPEPLVLSTLFTPEAAPQVRSFRARVFRGHLEQGGVPVPGLESVKVTITRVLHARMFDPRTRNPERLERFRGVGRRDVSGARDGAAELRSDLAVTVWAGTAGWTFTSS